MSCIFCDIVNKKIESKVVCETDEVLVIENINPSAPIHLLVLPRMHIDKNNCVKNSDGMFWPKLIEASFDVIKELGLDKTGYRLVNNGGGYQGIDHEHIHILGGKGWKPNDDL